MYLSEGFRECPPYWFVTLFAIRYCNQTYQRDRYQLRIISQTNSISHHLSYISLCSLMLVYFLWKSLCLHVSEYCYIHPLWLQYTKQEAFEDTGMQVLCFNKKIPKGYFYFAGIIGEMLIAYIIVGIAIQCSSHRSHSFEIY